MSKAEITIEHNGVELTLENDFWKGYCNNQSIMEEKLSVAKQRIDKIKKFKPPRIQALMQGGRNGPRLVDITSYDGHKPRITYKNDDGVTCRDTVYENYLYDNTPENLAIFEQMKPLHAESSRISSLLQTLSSKLAQKIVKEHGQTVRRGMAGQNEQS